MAKSRSSIENNGDEMSVVIKYMDMPDRCEHCEFCSWSNLYQTGHCSRLDATVPDYKTSVDSNCPMSAVVEEIFPVRIVRTDDGHTYAVTN